MLVTSLVLSGEAQAKKAKPSPQEVALARANKFFAQGKDAEAKNDLKTAAYAYRQCFDTRYQSFGFRDPELINVSSRLGKVLARQDNFLAAEEYLKWCLKAQVKQYGPGDLRLADAQKGLADLYRKQGNFRLASSKYAQVVTLYERYDEENADLLSARLDLAEALLKNDEREAADEQIKKVDQAISHAGGKAAVDTARLASLKAGLKEGPKEGPKEAQTKTASETKSSVTEEKPVAAEKPVATEKPVSASKPEASQAVPPGELAAGPGPLLQERKNVLGMIERSAKLGIGTGGYETAYAGIEAMVAAGKPEAEIKTRLDSIRKSLYEQLSKKALLSDPRYQNQKYAAYRRGHTEANATKFGLMLDNYTPMTPAQMKSFDKYDNTQITEGYMKQIEADVARTEMQRLPPNMKYGDSGKRFIKRRQDIIKRNRINHNRIQEGFGRPQSAVPERDTPPPDNHRTGIEYH